VDYALGSWPPPAATPGFRLSFPLMDGIGSSQPLQRMLDIFWGANLFRVGDSFGPIQTVQLGEVFGEVPGKLGRK
jgi:hypothetical protein